MENSLVVNNVGELISSNSVNQKGHTTIKDLKLLFNLESSVDYKLNDCKGETIKVVDYLVKLIEKDIENEDGTVTKENKRITILIDDKGKSYVTASKYFNIQFIKAVAFLGEDELKNNGLIIKIVDTTVKNSKNKALSFELV